MLNPLVFTKVIKYQEKEKRRLKAPQNVFLK